MRWIKVRFGKTVSNISRMSLRDAESSRSQILLMIPLHEDLRKTARSVAVRTPERIRDAMAVRQKEPMPSELAQWISPAIVILGSLLTGRAIRNLRVELRQDVVHL